MASTSKKGKQARREARLQQQRKNRRNMILISVGVIAIIAIPIGINIYNFTTSPGQWFRSLGNAHVAADADVSYNSVPPTSGPHAPNIIGWGSYNTVQNELQVIHNMEDAGVVLWYQNGTREENNEEIAKLEAVTSGFRRIVITPHDDLPSKYVLTAWQRLQAFDEIDREGMRRFISAYEGIDHHQ